jgi:hypothetical protein
MPITDNLVSFWELEEASGTRNDAHSTNHLTSNNAVGMATGKVGNAASLVRASSQTLSRATNASLETGDVSWTLCAWAKLDAAAVAGSHAIFGKYDGGAFDGEFQIYLDTDFGATAAYAILYSAAGQRFATTGNGAFSLNTWAFVVAWHDATADTINVQINNGTIYSTATLGRSSSILSGAFVVGGFTTANNLFHGLIDQAGYWKRALTVDERTTLYNSGSGVAYAALAGGGGAGTLAPAFPARPYRIWRK